MRTLESLSALVGILIVVMFGSAKAQERLLLDSFEDGSGAPKGWRRGANVDGVKYVYASIGSEGKKSLSLQKSANRYFPIAQWFCTVPHQSKTMKAVAVVAKVKAARATKAIIDLQFLDSDNNLISHEWAAYIGQQESGPVATHDWQDYGGSANIPAGTQQIGVALQIYGPGRVWFDEIEVFYTDDSERPVKRLDTTTELAQSVPDSATAPNARPMPKPRALRLTDGSWTRYITHEPDAENPPAGGYPLLFILPGGDGSSEFYPFINRLHRETLQSQFLIVQPIAPPHIVWPTATSGGRFSHTEAAIAGIYQEISQQFTVDSSKVFAMAWSSSGPAVYASLLDEQTPLTGAFIAMSVFKPQELPPLSQAAGKRVFLYHSPDDRVCPFWMAKDAQSKLTAAGLRITLAEYDGGHGWTGDTNTDVREGINWLLNQQ